MRFDLQDNSILIDGRAALTRNTLDFLQETLDFQQETLTNSCERFSSCAAYPAISPSSGQGGRDRFSRW